MSDVIVGAKLRADAAEATTNVRNFKKELKDAQAEVTNLSAKFGPMSKEVQAAAKRAAELNDQIQDAKQLTDAFNPDTKFRAFGAAISGVVGGFSALQGVMGLVGVESKEVEKQLLKVQSALALSQGVAQLQESMQSIKNLGAVLVNSLGRNGLIGVVIGLTAVTAAWLSGLFDGAKKATESQKAYNDTIEDFRKGAGGAIQKVTEVRNAFALASEGVISKEKALRIYNDTLGDSLGKTDSLAVAEKNLTDKADVYIRVTGLKAQANALFAIAAQKAAQALATGENDNEALIAEFGEEGFNKILATAKAKFDKNIADINNLAGDLLKQAEQLQKVSGVQDDITNKIQEDKAKAAKEASQKAMEQAKKDLEQAKKDLEETNRLRNQKIVGAVIPGLTAGVGKTVEEEEIERVAATHKRFRDQMAEVEGVYTNDYIANIEARKANEQAEFEQKKVIAESSMNLLNVVADLIGRQTAAGKVLAIASATINTFLGATEVLRAKSILPEPLATVVKIANVAAIIGSGISAVKKIVSTKVPGAGGGSVPSVPSVSAPLAPQAPGSTRTALDQQSLNAIGSATTRAFVLEADVSGSQERIRRINRAARI